MCRICRATINYHNKKPNTLISLPIDDEEVLQDTELEEQFIFFFFSLEQIYYLQCSSFFDKIFFFNSIVEEEEDWITEIQQLLSVDEYGSMAAVLKKHNAFETIFASHRDKCSLLYEQGASLV